MPLLLTDSGTVTSRGGSRVVGCRFFEQRGNQHQYQDILYTFMYIHIHIYTYIQFRFIYVHTYTYIYVCICLYVCM